MIMYVGAAQSEKQAQNAIKKYGNKYTHPDPEDETGIEVVWNGAVAMVSGCKLITGYQNGTNSFGSPIRVPVYHSLYWMNLLSPVPDNTLYTDVVNVGAPIIEFDFTLIGNKPSNFVRRSANLPAALVPIDTKILGITPVWGGSPNMGWLYDSAA